MINSEQRSDAHPPSARIIEALARSTDRRPTDLEPLYRYVDAEALDALLSSTPDAPGEVTVQFVYADEYEVTIDGRGEVGVERI